MRRFALLLLALPAFAQPAAAQKLTDEEVKEGFVSLFNGKDWSGWQFGGGYGLPDKVPANWSIGDGLIKLSGGGAPHLGTQWDYDDFEFRLEWRALKPKGKAKYNSGVYIRSGRKVNANQLNLAEGGEGGPVGLKAKGAKAVPNLQKPAGEWNEWKVRVIGDKITLWCNGELGFEATEFATLKPGYLGLQAEGAAMEFRNLRVKEIGWTLLNEWAAKSNTGWGKEGDAIVSLDRTFTPMLSMKMKLKVQVLRMEWKADKSAVAAVELLGLGDKGKLSLTAENPKGLGLGTVSLVKDSNPAGQWNYLEIRLQGDKATVWQNGKTVAENIAVGTQPAAGEAISLHADTAGVAFRNIRIKEIAK
jgi:hypothetical protein